MSTLFVTLSLFSIQLALSQFFQYPTLGFCDPPSRTSGTGCLWNCGDGVFNPRCEGIYYCSNNATSCQLNCLTENGCSENIIVISQTKGPTTVNCVTPRAVSCRNLAVNCGDFDNNVVASLQRYGMNNLLERLRDLRSNMQGNIMLRARYRPISAYFTKTNGQYSKCSLNCGGNGDNCEGAVLSCHGKFDTGCRMNVQSGPQSGNIFKSGQFLCGIENPPGHRGSCLLNCPSTGSQELPCVETRFGCVPGLGRFVKPGNSLGKCHCIGDVCTHPSTVLVSTITMGLPLPPTPRPTMRPTSSPTMSPTKRPTASPIPPTFPHPTSATGAPVKATKRPTRAALKTIGATPFKFENMLEFMTTKDRAKLKGNQLVCNGVKCEMKCHQKGTCSDLIVRVGAKVVQFKLSCEGKESCTGMEVYSDSQENQLECKGIDSCHRANFNFGGRLVSKTKGQKVELQCQEGGCGKETQLNCGSDVADCLLQTNSSPSRVSFGGVLNCYTKHTNGVCKLQCSNLIAEPACKNARFNCMAAKTSQCSCTTVGNGIYKDCPKINNV